MSAEKEEEEEEEDIRDLRRRRDVFQIHALALVMRVHNKCELESWNERDELESWKLGSRPLTSFPSKGLETSLKPQI